MAKPPQQPLDGRSGSIAGIMSMLGAPNVGIGGGGGNPGMGMPQPWVHGPLGRENQRNASQYTTFESWLSGIYGQMQPPPEALAALYQQYQQEAGQWAGQGGVGDQIQQLLQGRQLDELRRQRPGAPGDIGTYRGRG